jgi:anti-anti-sigma factor
MNLTVSDVEGDPRTHVLEAYGEIDLATAPDLSVVIDRLAAERETCLIVDLEHVSFIDSSGLAALISGHKRFAEVGGKLFVACSSPLLRRGFEITGVTELLGLAESRELAVGAAHRFIEAS